MLEGTKKDLNHSSGSSSGSGSGSGCSSSSIDHNYFQERRTVLLSAMSHLFSDMADIIVRKSRSVVLQGEQLKVCTFAS